MSNDIPTYAGTSLAAAAKREANLKELALMLARALNTYRKQHDAAYIPQRCHCVNCVLTTSLLERVAELK